MKNTTRTYGTHLKYFSSFSFYFSIQTSIFLYGELPPKVFLFWPTSLPIVLKNTVVSRKILTFIVSILLFNGNVHIYEKLGLNRRNRPRNHQDPQDKNVSDGFRTCAIQFQGRSKFFRGRICKRSTIGKSFSTNKKLSKEEFGFSEVIQLFD